MGNKAFLTTRWSHLAMLNYEVNPAILRDRVPAGTELDCYDGRSYVSMVGFLYHDTRVLGVPIPFHRHFAEVNLRFYVRHHGPEGWRRGVCFVKEVVPKRAIAWLARVLYEEPFVRLPMRYAISQRKGTADIPDCVEFQWKYAGNWQRLAVQSKGNASTLTVGGEEEFIAEHYWGYTSHRDGTTSEYEVKHPSWRVWQVSALELKCDVASLYGPEFAEPLNAAPHSAFLAEGSEVTVCRGKKLTI